MFTLSVFGCFFATRNGKRAIYQVVIFAISDQTFVAACGRLLYNSGFLGKRVVPVNVSWVSFLVIFVDGATGVCGDE